MEQMRDILRSLLSRSLSELSPLDRLSTAWPVAAGSAIALRSSVFSLTGSVALIHVADTTWLAQLRAMTPRLRAELERIAAVPLTDILFQVESPLPSPPSAAKPAYPPRKPAKSWQPARAWQKEPPK